MFRPLMLTIFRLFLGTHQVAIEMHVGNNLGEGRESKCVGTRYRIVKKWCLNWIALVKHYAIDTCLCFITAKLEASFITCYIIILLYMIF
jgi:hypothetical protein